MATTRASGYVVTHTVWNDVLSGLTDNGQTYSGAINGSTIAGTTLTLSGFGAHTISAGGTGGNILAVRNTTAGVGNYGAVHIGNDTSDIRVRVLSLSTTYTSVNDLQADGCTVLSSGVGGLQLSASNASGVIRLYTGSGPTEHVKLNASGKFLLRHGSATHDENYAPLTITGPGTNFGQQLSFVRSGAAIWSLGYAYNTSTFAIGAGSSTDSNFTAAAAALTIDSSGNCTIKRLVVGVANPSFGTQNDYDAGGASLILFTSGIGGACTLTGVTGGIAGRQIWVMRSAGSSADITLNHEDAGSTAANRFTCVTGANITVTSSKAVQMIYDGNTSRWIVFDTK